MTVGVLGNLAGIHERLRDPGAVCEGGAGDDRDRDILSGHEAAGLDRAAGTSPGDVDVLVVGNPDRAAVHGAAGEAERELGREVNIRVVSSATWEGGEDLFLKTVRDRPLTRLDLTPEET